MRLCDVLRTAGWIAGSLWPEQAVRALRGRDFDAAVARTDEALAVAEESVDCWEPDELWMPDGPSAMVWPEPEVQKDPRPVRVSRAADSPAAGERTPDNRPAAGRTFGQVERDAYFAGLTWPEPEAEPTCTCPCINCSNKAHWMCHGEGVEIDTVLSDHDMQIEHVADLVESWLEAPGGATSHDLATRRPPRLETVRHRGVAGGR